MKKTIAMWSGPRNLSTAMMYSFAQRRDCVVVDEPLYGVFLRKTGINHPMREQTLKAMPESEDEVIERLLSPQSRPIFYQKHMTHHLLPDMRRDWIHQVTNVFFIRHPARVIASYGVKRDDFTLEDLGFNQQGALFDYLQSQGQTPLVIDSFDIRANTPKTLQALCEALHIEFDPAMLHWSAGGHSADGVWAAHWYDRIHQSTGFAGAEGALPKVSKEHSGIYEACLEIYEKLAPMALK